MRVLDAAKIETKTSISEMKTRQPSILFQPLRKYEFESSTKPLDNTCHNKQRQVMLVTLAVHRKQADS